MKKFNFITALLLLFVSTVMFTDSGILSANLHEVLVRTCSNCGHIDLYDLETLLNN